MAEGGQEGGRGTIKEKIVEELTVLLKDFIWRWLQRHAFRDAVVIREALGATEPLQPGQQKVSQTLQFIGDEVDGDAQLRRLMNNSSIVFSKDVFFKVLISIFEDGQINWGRVVAVFCFACLLIMKANDTNIFDMIRNIIKWIIEYFQEKVINWIQEQGGWEGVFSYFGTPTWQFVAVFLAGVLTTLFIVKKM